MSERPRVSAEVQKSIDEFHADTVAEVKNAIGAHHVVVVGMAQNPFVRKVRGALTAAGIEFHYLEYGSYLSEWKRRLAIKLWTGFPTFPMVFVDGELIGGEDMTKAAIANGTLKPGAGK